MKRSTANKLNMYESVHAVLTDHQSSWQTVPAFASAVTTFETKLNLLRARLVEQLGATTGVSMEKNLRTEDLRKRMLVMQNALFLLGRASNELQLQERNHLSKSDLIHMKLNEFAARCTELKGDLTTYGTQLAAYGITQQAIDELIPLLSGIDELNNSTRKAIIKRKSITKAIADLEQELNELLRVELDRLILVFRESEPPFYQSFESARITINYGGGGTRPQGTDPLSP
ncbi:hypothetical protein [Fluviicola taffensis]|uniref:hypothetical protein n=1 Tax=Fluviicola taffensis TaxID=191579 RepID=UPI003137C3E1